MFHPSSMCPVHLRSSEFFWIFMSSLCPVCKPDVNPLHIFRPRRASVATWRSGNPCAFGSMLQYAAVECSRAGYASSSIQDFDTRRISKPNSWRHFDESYLASSTTPGHRSSPGNALFTLLASVRSTANTRRSCHRAGGNRTSARSSPHLERWPHGHQRIH